MDLHAGLLTTAVTDDRKPATTPPRRPFLAAAAILGLLVGAAVWGILRYAAHEQQRDLRNWQARLDLIAGDRAGRIEHWLQGQYRALQELADNASLQLYLSQLQFDRPTAAADTEPAQLGYLRNLIRASALNHGFYRDTAITAGIAADLPQPQPRGLALLDRHGRPVVSTPGMPPPTAAVTAVLQRVLETGEPALIDLHRDRTGAYLLGFAQPVAPVKGVQGDGARVGAIVGLRDPAETLFGLVTARTGMLDGDETLLVEQRGDSVLYLSPLADGARPLERRLALNTPDLAAAVALRQPGRFAQAVDYAGTPVLMTSRAIAGTPWVLVQKTPAALALKETGQRRRTLLTTASLALFLMTAILIAAWWHGTSVRTARLAAELDQRSRELEARSRLLHSITDNIRDHIFILDADNRFLYANRPLADACGVDVTAFRGKTLAAVLGPATAHRLETECCAGGGPAHSLALEIGAAQGDYHCASLILPAAAGMPGARLFVLHDVTELEATQRRHANLLQQLVQALVRAVDKHDPYSADHSARVAAVALAIGKAMELSRQELETLEMAAYLANIGKLFVPAEILAKTGSLDETEQAVLREHVQHALEILQGLEFEGPVLETIAQKQEHMDGSGYPLGLAGDAILPTARILAVANAFVALVSPRAWRKAVRVEEALDRLLADSGSKYDRRVVAALMHVIENRPDWGLVELVAGGPQTPD